MLQGWILRTAAPILVANSCLATTFYRTPKSLFASGESSPEYLYQFKNGVEYSFDFRIANHGKDLWLSHQEVLTANDVSEVFVVNGENFRITKQDGAWMELERLADARKDWQPVANLRPAESDFGRAFLVAGTALRSGPSWETSTQALLPARSNLQVLDIGANWLKVKYHDEIGYVDINSVILKADFAKEVQDKHGRWIEVLYRDGAQLITESKGHIDLTSIEKWRCEPQRGIILKSIPEQNLFLRSRVQIEKIQAKTWYRAKLPGHGTIYFQDDANTNQRDFIAADKPQTAEELLKREIFSLAFARPDGDLAVASAHGIFLTHDGGFTWKKILQLPDEDVPVAIGTRDEIYTGLFRSTDAGKSFQPYIRTDYLTQLLVHENSGRPPRQVRLANLEIRKGMLRLKVELGGKVVILETDSRTEVFTEWRVIRI